MNSASIGQHSLQPSFARIISDLECQLRHSPKMKVVSLNDDEEYIARVADTMLPKEKLGAWLARTNFAVSRAAAFTMTKSEIAEAAAAGERACIAAGMSPTRWKPRPFASVRGEMGEK